jgi:hypothetical protein
MNERRIWAAIVLGRDAWTCEAILERKPVIAANLDPESLRRALRGEPLPPASEFVLVLDEMLDAIAEAGPLTLKRKERRR